METKDVATWVKQKERERREELEREVSDAEIKLMLLTSALEGHKELVEGIT